MGVPRDLTAGDEGGAGEKLGVTRLCGRDDEWHSSAWPAKENWNLFYFIIKINIQNH